MSDIGHNGVVADELKAFIERIERLDEELRRINGDKSDVFKEAKGRGFDAKAMRRIMANRRKDPDRRAEEDGIYELYCEALGVKP